MKRTTIVAEVGLNFAFGNDKSKFLDNAKKLIDVAVVAGCDYVKFQKRDPDTCVPDGQKLKPKKVPWRSNETTYLQYKKDIELGKAEFDEIDRYCKEKGIKWFASVWDIKSVKFMANYSTTVRGGVTFGEFIEGIRVMKIPSALITNKELCEYARLKSDYLIISTGMSTEGEINDAIRYADPNLIMHTNSSYPSKVSELRLEYITWLKDNHTTRGYEEPRDIGYSGHEFGLVPTFTAVSLGATWVERHITLDRTFWGSDQHSSLEPSDIIKLVKGIRDIEIASGGNHPRNVLPSELAKKKTLRK